MPAIDVLPIGGLALLLGVDRFMAEIRAATNLASNVIATLVVARWSGAIDMAQARDALYGDLEAVPKTGRAAAGD
jgi:Na+/H+-dicarboxylate symporter